MSGEVDQVAIKEMYQRLIASRDKAIDFDDSIKRDIEASRKFDSDFCCSDPFYQEQVSIVGASMPDNIEKETVGAYLYGCFLPELAVEIACTPDCINGLRNPELDACDIASYEKNNAVLVKLNNINTEDANVFIISGEQLTPTDREKLKQDGVKVVTIFNQDGDSINYILGESINLYEPEEPQPPPPPPEEGSNPWGWIWLILLIIIITGLASILLR